MAGGITAAVAAVGSLAVGAIGAANASSASDQQLGMANSQLGMEESLFGQQQQYRNQLQQLLADPSSVSKLPSYDFFKKQGEESVTRRFAANPGGSEGVALTEFGQNYASSAYEQQVQLLAGLSGLTQNPASLGGVGVGAGGNAITGSANSFQQLQQLLAQGGSIAKMFGPGGALASAGTPANPGVPWAGAGTDPNAGQYWGGIGPPGVQQ